MWICTVCPPSVETSNGQILLEEQYIQQYLYSRWRTVQILNWCCLLEPRILSKVAQSLCEYICCILVLENWSALTVRNLLPKLCVEKAAFAADRRWRSLVLNQLVCILNWPGGSIQKEHAVFPNTFQLKVWDKPEYWPQVSNIPACSSRRSNTGKMIQKRKKNNPAGAKLNNYFCSCYLLVFRQLLCILA